MSEVSRIRRQTVTERNALGLFSPRVFNKDSRRRFTRHRVHELIEHLGRAPSYTERILLARIVANEWDLRRLDARLDDGEELSANAARLRLALENRLRLDLREIGFSPPKPPVPTLDDIRAQIVSEKRARGAA
jgi:hypothetical protein